MIIPPTMDRAIGGGPTVRADPPSARGPQRPFAQTLAGFLDHADDAAMPTNDPGPVAARQGEATDGKPVPDDEDAATADPAFAWLTITAPVIPLRPVSFTLPPVAAASARPAPVAAPDAAMTAGVTVVAGLVADLPAITAPPTTDPPPVQPTATPTPTGIVRDAAGALVDMPVEVEPSVAIVPTDPIIAGTPPAPAGQVFAAAIKAARDDDRAAATPRDLAAPLAPLATAGSADVRVATATSDAQQAPLDLRRPDWPQGMIDRIEHLREAADAADTRIRLIPDALGAIDVGVRRDGDTMHVHFTADQPATATLLADARQQLATLAQSRGLTLGQSAVDTGAGQSQAQSQPQHQAARPPHAPVSIVDPTAAPATGADAIRLA